MNTITITFAVIALVAVFSLALPFDTAVAQADDPVSDGGEDTYKDRTHEGKSCPNKEKKSASINQSS
ncbi:MAG: hypothetical protein OEL56_06925 [Nitrosopumilus sp.]|nr:hypothetical protein [Nitrosopumilus sp.]MDH3490165.1 hypothetical protein [Nitrosopumilus sp.]MDH3516904.1 hypothetical protein [Nitrosopumilus sp.]MDH3565279.1 hypothetical protein [Nitrosopumilus sp.]MDH5416665.1 hypothetical protein [Nitrosopumilus sp.]